MIRKKTVFVLGAGVSNPFGLPLGAKLLSEIAIGVATKGPLFVLLAEMMSDARKLLAFGEYLSHCDRLSIDAWLEANQEFLYLGKCAIAAQIATAEARSIELEWKHGVDWFRWVWNKMAGSQTDASTLLENQVTFITFNYDRFLEARLYRALHNSYPRAGQETLQKVGKHLASSVIHMHGWIGRENALSYWNSMGQPYHEVFKLNEVSLAKVQATSEGANERRRIAVAVDEMASGIKIIGEPGLGLHAKAIEAVATAEKVVFLGFGYETRNLERLGVPTWVREKKDWPSYPRNAHNVIEYPLIGSAYGLEAAEAESVRRLFGGRIYLGEKDQDAVLCCRQNLALS